LGRKDVGPKKTLGDESEQILGTYGHSCHIMPCTVWLTYNMAVIVPYVVPYYTRRKLPCTDLL
jgi:hypothetical protein